MKARKENKIYQITEMQKASYLAQGFDILDDNGKVIEHSPASMVPYADYKKVIDELDALKSKGKKNKESDEAKAE